MASIFKRSDTLETSWQAIIRRAGHPQQSKAFPTRGEAEAWAGAIEADMRRGSYQATGEAERTTFADLAKRFTKDFAPHHYRGEAWSRKLAALTARLGAYSLVALTPQVVTKFRDDRSKDLDSRYTKNLKAPKVSPATVKGELDLLSKVLDVAEKEFGITLPAGNPVRHIRKPTGGAARDRRLTADEWTKLLAECRASQNRYLAPAVVLAVETAMRQGELLQIERKNVDKKRRLVLLLDQSKIKTGEPRAVPLSSAALAALEELPTAIGGPLIPIGRMTLYKAFERACHRAGIQGYCWHLLRHESLSRLAERGDFSTLELSAISGHKTLQVLKRYTHLQAETLAKKLG